MEIGYFDSSVVISMLLRDSNAKRALEIWEDAKHRVTSRLLVFECETLIRRCAARLPEKGRARWAKDARDWLSRNVSRMVLHEVDATVLEILRRTADFGECRTLDAIHLSTAMLFTEHAAELSLVTFDKRMKDAAARLKLRVVM